MKDMVDCSMRLGLKFEMNLNQGKWELAQEIG